MTLFNIENQGANVYLVYKIEKQDKLDTISLGMITHNKIKGLAPIIYTQMDLEEFLKFDISAKVPLRNYFAGTVNKNRLISVFIGLTEALIAAEEYMIDASSFVLDLDYIFVDVSTSKTFMICLPIIKNEAMEENKVDLLGFFKNIIFTSQFDQNENMDYFAKIVNYLNHTTFFSLSDYLVLLKTINGENLIEKPPIQQAQPAPIPVAAPVNNSAAKPGMLMEQGQPAPIPVAAPVKNSANRPEMLMEQCQPFAIPQHEHKTVKPKKVNNSINTQADPNEKEITFMYLMQHYNKENKALYDAQKARKKAKKQEEKAEKTNRKGKKSKDGQLNPQTNPQFNPQLPNNYQQPNNLQPQNNYQQPNNFQPQNNFRQPVQNDGPIYSDQSQQFQLPVNETADNFGGTVVLNSTARKGTTVLGLNSNTQANSPYLLRKKNNEKINLSKQLLRIGRDKSLVEYCVGDNDAISNYHADLSCVETEFFVTDMNSTNHTYVDGVQIQSMLPVKLSHGTKIKLGNEEFEFCTY